MSFLLGAAVLLLLFLGLIESVPVAAVVEALPNLTERIVEWARHL